MPRVSLWIQVAIFTVTRMVLNMNTRIIYPFLPVFARGLGVDLMTVSALVANRSLIGTAIPFLFPFIETRGRRACSTNCCRGDGRSATWSRWTSWSRSRRRPRSPSPCNR